VQGIPFQKLAVWALVAALAYELKDFFGIAIGTFIVSFIGNSFVNWSDRSRAMQVVSAVPAVRRRILVAVFFSFIAALLSLFGLLTIPDIVREGADFVGRLQSDNIWVVLVQKMREGLGDQIMESLERFVRLATSSDLASALSPTPGREWTIERSTQLGLAVSKLLKGYTTTAATVTAGMLSSVTKFALQGVISLILSFMLVWDLPAISAGVASLKVSRLSAIYEEVVPVFAVFGKLFGKALEAQARIAAVNTALTAAGMWVLAIPGAGLLSLFVFICSFIPVAGVIISTIPMGFVALTEYGFTKLALVILMVTMVHFVEAYALNPAIYSAHLKLHPLMVLSVLVVAEHSLGVWGLLLAVPLTVFALDYCIRYPESTVTEVGAKELEKVLNRSEDEGSGEEERGRPLLP